MPPLEKFSSFNDWIFNLGLIKYDLIGLLWKPGGVTEEVQYYGS